MKFFVYGKKRIIMVAVIAVALVAIGVNFPVAKNLVVSAVANRQLPIYSVDSDKKEVALTFDAAWGNEDTEQLIEIFEKYDIKVTFFVTGGWVDKYPESVKQLYDAGHDVMNHSDGHKHMSKLSEQEIIADITACNEKITNITGVTPHLFRAPYGDYNDTLIKTMTAQNMYTIQWDVDSLDWKDKTPAEISEIVLKKVTNGSIVLFHNGAKNTPATLPSIIENLKRQGYEFKTVSDIIMTENYTINFAGKQIANEPENVVEEQKSDENAQEQTQNNETPSNS